MISTASLLGARHLWEIVENKPASSLGVSLGKALNGTPPPLCGRQVAQTSRKWQLPSECGLPVQNIAIQFAFLWMEDKYVQYKCMHLDCNFWTFLVNIYFCYISLNKFTPLKILIFIEQNYSGIVFCDHP